MKKIYCWNDTFIIFRKIICLLEYNEKSGDIDVLLIGQSGYCKTCFLTAINHKFRATLGKSKIIRHGDSILIDHSTELNSSVLLHLLKAGMNESTRKKLMFKIAVLYIDGKI